MKKFLLIILSSLILLLTILLYSRFIGTNGLVTHEIPLELNLPASYDGMKIIHFSDLHYKKVITEKRVKELVQEINKNKPDLVLFTGDLLDKDYSMTNQDINFLIKELKKIKSVYGNYAVIGDQDKKQEENIKNIYIQSNFTILENQSTTIYNEANEKITLIGLGSYLNNMDIEQTYTSISDQNAPQIAIVHEPDAIIKIKSKNPNTALILAGHSINGSINLPLIKQLLLPNGAKKYTKLNDKKQNIFITNGIGVNQVNFRLFNTPSINLYRIKIKY